MRSRRIRSRLGSRSATGAIRAQRDEPVARGVRTRPPAQVVINGFTYDAYDFRPEQYDSLLALTRTLPPHLPQIKPIIPEKDGAPYLNTLEDRSISTASSVTYMSICRTRSGIPGLSLEMAHARPAGVSRSNPAARLQRNPSPAMTC